MSQEWITTMRVHQLSNGANQPFYNVLVQDGTCRYAAQGTHHLSDTDHYGERMFAGCVMTYEIIKQNHHKYVYD